MTRSCINICLLAVISLLFGVIWQGSALAAMPVVQPLGQITDSLQGPSRVAVDAAGNLYVANISGKNIVKFDKYGNRTAVFGSVAVSGYGLAVRPDGSAIYAATGTGVVVLDAAGISQGYLGAGPGEFQDAGAIAVALNGDVLVADTVTRQVKVFSAAGGSFVLSGVGFGGISSIAVDPVQGDIYIADPIFEGTQTPQLYVFHSDYTLKSQLDAATAFGSRLQYFGGLTFDAANRLYAADSESGNIRILELPATLLGTYGSGSTIIRPNSIAFDAVTGRLFVIWAGNRVDVFGVDGGSTPVQVNTAPGVPQPITVGEVGSLTPGLQFANSVDAEHDALTYNVRVFDAAGSPVAAFSVAEGSGPTVATVGSALVENAEYTWQVQADDGQATSSWSAATTIAINAVEEPPTAPVLDSFLAGETAGSSATLTWVASSDADPNATLSYRTEVFEGTALVASKTTSVASVGLSDLSSGLIPGATYSWRVVAVDNTSLETISTNNGSFVFQPSALKITSSVAGSKVYLGGHHGYAGRALGVVPVEVRDLPAGSYSIVVEAAGFEPYVATVALDQDATVEVVADLKGARLATGFATHGLDLAGQAVAGVDVAPIVVDLNKDGVLDLLLANNGTLAFYAGSVVQDPLTNETIENLANRNSGLNTPSRVVFSTTGQPLALPQIAGATPCLVDWNNDDQFDLLVGGADGSVNLFLGDGSANYFAVSGQWLVSVGSQAIPVVADLDGDGDKDLIVGSGNDLLLFNNVGTDDQPVLDTQSALGTLTAPVVPLFTDWNADGTRELMVLVQGELFEALMSNGQVTSLATTGLSVAGADRVFALNFADSHYNDLVFGTSAGSLVVANSQQGGFSPAYKEALLVKLADVEQLVLSQAPGLIGRVANIASRIGRGKYASAQKRAEQLRIMLGTGTPAAVAINELANILN